MTRCEAKGDKQDDDGDANTLHLYWHYSTIGSVLTQMQSSEKDYSTSTSVPTQMQSDNTLYLCQCRQRCGKGQHHSTSASTLLYICVNADNDMGKGDTTLYLHRCCSTFVSASTTIQGRVVLIIIPRSLILLPPFAGRQAQGGKKDERCSTSPHRSASLILLSPLCMPRTKGRRRISTILHCNIVVIDADDLHLH